MLKRYSGQFWLLSFSSYLFFSSFNMLIPELPGYLSRMGGEEYLGLIIFLFTVTAGVSRPFSGKLTDKWGRIPVMLVGAIVSGVAALLYPAFTTVWGFLFIRLFHGFSTGFKPTGTSAYIADIVPANRRGEALGISSFFGTIGMASGPAIGSWIYNEFGINSLFYTSSIFAFASVGILFGMKETLTPRSSFHPGMLKIGLKDIFEKNVLAPSIVMILTTLSFGTILTLTPNFSDFLEIGNRGLFFNVFTGSSLLVRIVGGQISDRYGRLSTLRISTFVMFISMVIIGLSDTPTQFFAGAFLFGLGYGFNSPTLFAWTIDLCQDHNRGKGIATLYIFLEVGIGFGALISGTVYQGFNERFAWIFGVAGLFSLIAFLYIITYKQNKQPQ